MILQALVQYYEALLARGEIDRPGWSKVNVSWRLDLNPDGSLFDVSPLQKPSPNGKKMLPQQLAVPAQVKRSSGVAANFLCDTSSYLLGVDDKGKPERTKACFEASREKHLEILKDTPGEAAAAVRAFFDTWSPSSAAEHPALQPYLSEIYKGGNLIFYYNNKSAANDSDIAAAWQQAYDSASDSDTPTRCSVTGRLAPAARLHGNIQGVRGAQSSGASLVSFNADAFCSYGHEQGENAPVSTYAMTAYTQALNYLLRSDNVRRIGDVTVVYWVENADPAAAAFAGAMLFGPQDDWTETDILTAIQKLVSGRSADLQDMHLSPDTHFYILGLAPNAARRHRFAQALDHHLAGERPGGGGALRGIMVGLIADELAPLVAGEGHAQERQLHERARRERRHGVGVIAVRAAARIERLRHGLDRFRARAAQAELIVGLLVAARVSAGAGGKIVGDQQHVHAGLFQLVRRVQPRRARADHQRIAVKYPHRALLYRRCKWKPPSTLMTSPVEKGSRSRLSA